MTNPYNLLGVSQKATGAEIKSAYRKLARKLHPDLNPNDKDAEERFKKVTAAYDLLSDAGKRARYDRGEIDGEGNERAPYSSYHRRPDETGGFNFNFGNASEDIFSQFFRQNASRPEPGSDLHHTITIPFLDAALGTEETIILSSGKTLSLRIPAGSADGSVLRLKNQGNPGKSGGPTGNALIKIRITPHPYFVRKGNDILLALPISLQEAVLGGKVNIPTIHGTVTVTISAGSNSGSILRLRGKGVPYGGDKRGDQLVTLHISLPEKIDQNLHDFIVSWGESHEYDPRTTAGMS